MEPVARIRQRVNLTRFATRPTSGYARFEGSGGAHTTLGDSDLNDLVSQRRNSDPIYAWHSSGDSTSNESLHDGDDIQWSTPTPTCAEHPWPVSHGSQPWPAERANADDRHDPLFVSQTELCVDAVEVPRSLVSVQGSLLRERHDGLAETGVAAITHGIGRHLSLPTRRTPHKVDRTVAPTLPGDEHSSPSSPATSIACANVSNQSLFSGQVRRQISLEMPYGDEAEPPGLIFTRDPSCMSADELHEYIASLQSQIHTSSQELVRELHDRDVVLEDKLRLTTLCSNVELGQSKTQGPVKGHRSIIRIATSQLPDLYKSLGDG